MMREKLRGAVKFFWDILFPIECFGCGKEGVKICEACKEGIPLRHEEFLGCPVCKKVHQEEKFGGTFCPGHMTFLRGVWTIGSYKNPLLRELIHNFKYRFEEDLEKDFYDLTRRFLEYTGKREEIRSFFHTVAPVPLHPRRLAERGYNQAALIAKGMAEYLELPLEEELLSRTRYTSPQAKLETEARWGNVAGAFRVKDSSLVSGKRILLVDDVYTTGNTLEACAAELKKAGAKSVWAFVIARG